MNKARSPLLSSVCSALDILGLFSSYSPEMSLGEIANKLGIGKSRAHRLLATMLAKHFIEQDPQTGRYRPGITNLWMGRLYDYTNRLIQESRPLAQQLVQRINRVVHVATLVEGEVIYLVRELPPDAPRWNLVGSVRVSPHRTALGKAMMACMTNEEISRIITKTGLPSRTVFTITKKDVLMERINEIRRRGYALDDEESDEDQMCVGVALKNITGQLLGAISISGRKRGMNEEIIEEYAGTLKSIANELAGRLGPYILPVQMVPEITRNTKRQSTHEK
jgi:IclR family transcriptional regulator, KDG regulon repressor